MDHLADPFFLAGIAAVLFIFLTFALIGLSLFSTGASRHKALRAQSVVLGLQLILLAWLVVTLWEQLEPMKSLPEPRVAEIEVWYRRAISVLLLAIATVLTSLLTTFGWVRTGNVGNSMRSVIWAIPAVKVVIASVVVLGLLDQAHLSSGPEAIPVGDLPEVATAILSPLTAIATVWLPGCLAMFVVSLVISLGKRGRNSGD